MTVMLQEGCDDIAGQLSASNSTAGLFDSGHISYPG
jgi:hypothetical protein